MDVRSPLNRLLQNIKPSSILLARIIERKHCIHLRSRRTGRKNFSYIAPIEIPGSEKVGRRTKNERVGKCAFVP